MFGKVMYFKIKRDDANVVIDALSRYGNPKMTAMRDGKDYSVEFSCRTKDYTKCMDALFALGNKGVLIWNFNSDWTL